MARAVGTQHKKESGDTRGLLYRSFGGHPARVTPDPSDSYLMAPQQHTGKEKVTFVPIRQIATRICDPTKELIKKMDTIKDDKIGTKLWTPSSQQEIALRWFRILRYTAANMDMRSLTHRAVCGDVGIPLKQGQSGLVKQPHADT